MAAWWACPAETARCELSGGQMRWARRSHTSGERGAEAGSRWDPRSRTPLAAGGSSLQQGNPNLRRWEKNEQRSWAVSPMQARPGLVTKTRDLDPDK